VIVPAGLIASRFVHYVALSILLGGAVFPLYGFDSSQERRPVPVWLRVLLLFAASLALMSGISWFLFTTAGVSGNPGAVTDLTILSTVIRHTWFGRVWFLRLLLGIGLVLLLLPADMTRPRFQAVQFGSVILLASIALTGHSGADKSAAGLHIVADAFHLLAAGVWVGALIVLVRQVMSIRQSRDYEQQNLHRGLSRFSGIGTIVVAALTLTGFINPGFFASSRFETPYGRILLVKLTMFGAMLLLAATNRFWLTPWLARTLESGSGWKNAVASLRWSLLAEAALALLIMASVAWLGTLAPLAPK
jgi:copper resistance protein D